MRFNHPAEAKHLRSVLPHSRISMAPITFTPPADGCQQQQPPPPPPNENHHPHRHLERKPPVAPRKSPRNSCSDDEIGFLGKLTKFEMLSRQQGTVRSGCVSPKVFPAGALTTNVPADQILGHARSSSLVSLTRSPVNGYNDDSPSRSATSSLCRDEPRRRSSDTSTPPRGCSPSLANASNNRAQNRDDGRAAGGMYGTSACLKSRENVARTPSPRFAVARLDDPMSRSMTCQGSNELEQLVERDCDMSQSLIVARTTTTTEYLQLQERRGSSPNVVVGEAADALVVRPSAAHDYGASAVRRLQPPSPAFDRDQPRYSEQRRVGATAAAVTAVVRARVKSPAGRSLEELRERQADAESKRREAECRRKRAQEERLKEQEVERQERLRLEEILLMCAEYERQSSAVEKPRQPNR